MELGVEIGAVGGATRVSHVAHQRHVASAISPTLFLQGLSPARGIDNSVSPSPKSFAVAAAPQRNLAPRGLLEDVPENDEQVYHPRLADHSRHLAPCAVRHGFGEV